MLLKWLHEYMLAQSISGKKSGNSPSPWGSSKWLPLKRPRKVDKIMMYWWGQMREPMIMIRERKYCLFCIKQVLCELRYLQRQKTLNISRFWYLQWQEVKEAGEEKRIVGKKKSWITLLSLHHINSLATSCHSGDFFVYSITIRRPLQIIGRDVLRSLVLLCPLPNGFKISAFVYSVEIYKDCRRLWIPPDLAEYPSVHGAHELLPKNV